MLTFIIFIQVVALLNPRKTRLLKKWTIDKQEDNFL